MTAGAIRLDPFTRVVDLTSVVVVRGIVVGFASIFHYATYTVNPFTDSNHYHDHQVRIGFVPQTIRDDRIGTFDLPQTSTARVQVSDTDGAIKELWCSWQDAVQAWVEVRGTKIDNIQDGTGDDTIPGVDPGEPVMSDFALIRAGFRALTLRNAAGVTVNITESDILVEKTGDRSVSIVVSLTAYPVLAGGVWRPIRG